VIEEVLEEVLFEVEAGIRYVITDQSVRGGEVVKHSISQPKAPLGSYVLRRMVSGKNRRSWSRSFAASVPFMAAFNRRPIAP
jgi:hypothetical protein